MKKNTIKTWESKKEFKEEVYLFADKVKIKVSHINIRPMTRKWASCSTSGYFTFNLELLGMERSLGEYVILHELLHYHVPNHGKLWKSLLELNMPDHEERARSLKNNYNDRE